jgi:uncharacterized protein YndB with AHSA1/START domain
VQHIAELAALSFVFLQPDFEEKFNAWTDKEILPMWFSYLKRTGNDTNVYGNWHR